MYTFSFALLAVAAGAQAAVPQQAEAAARPGHAAIASAHKLATEAGFEALAQGGNAFDAAVAVAAALSVVEPQSSGIGGGGMFLLHVAGDGKADSIKDVFVDARETAPAAVDAKDYLAANGDLDKDHSLNGPLSAAIPGEPAGLVWLAGHYGKLPLAKSMAPAIRIARAGFAVDKRFVDEVRYRKPIFERYAAAKSLFLVNGEVPQAGWIFKNPDIAKTLELIAAKGNDGFYRGEFAARLVDDVKKNGGRWSLEDLANYQVKEREPIAFKYHDWQIVTAPPPSSGGIAIEEMLNILSGYDLAKLDRVHRTHLIVEAMRRAYRDRAQYLGDPDFVNMPLDELSSPLYAAGLRSTIHPEKATPSDLLPPYMTPPQGPHTTHFSIIDKDGNRVAATQTVNFVFGSGMVVPGTGFLLNDEMDDFALVAGKPNVYGVVGTDANAPAAGRRPLSSMSPSFVVGADRIGVIGTPGGSRIITMVLEGILAFIDGEQPEKFVGNPRYHHQYLPDVISAEKSAFTADE
ncbi:MAG: gamma-glutamyltransferase, partial [Proteobacteria bacterium]|nr:gamma-glutamyltransferase [Pseudomonadota bacterium]